MSYHMRLIHRPCGMEIPHISRAEPRQSISYMYLITCMYCIWKSHVSRFRVHSPPASRSSLAWQSRYSDHEVRPSIAMATTESAPRKRKTLDDFFKAGGGNTKKLRIESEVEHEVSSEQLRSFALPPGLSTIPTFIDDHEEAGILAFLDKQPWRTDLARRTMHFGGTYCLMPSRSASPETRQKISETIITAPSMPREFDFLIDRMVSHGLYSAEGRPEYCIVNEYRAGHGISAHVENFRFGEPVCGLTMAGADEMRFYELEGDDDGSVRSGKAGQAKRTGRKVDIGLKRRELMIMNGPARRSWQHEIVRGKTKAKGKHWRRVSLTFRAELPTYSRHPTA